jgi:hypothetical protein
MSSHATQNMSHRMQQCIQKCLECYRVCLETVTHCLEKGGQHAGTASSISRGSRRVTSR